MEVWENWQIGKLNVGRFNFKPIFVQFFIKINIWLLSIIKCSFFFKHKITNFRELLFYYKKKFKQLHTFITKIYEELRKTLTPHETKSQLMLITGHTTMLALEKYLRDIDVELPEDYSDLIDKVNKNN